MSDSNPRDLIRQDIDDSRRDGLSLATAIVIRAEDSWIGVGMEYEAIRARHGRMHEDWTPTSQRLLSRDENGRSYDQVNIALCCVPCDHVPRRSYPLFLAREVLQRLAAEFESRPARPN